MRDPSALATISHTANGDLPDSVVVAGASAGRRRTRASLHGSAQGSPARAGGKQRGNGQNGQQSSGGAHVFFLDPQRPSVTDFEAGG